MKRKLSTQFFGSFLAFFVLTILATALAFVLLSFASGLISASLAKNRFPAEQIAKDDYTEIDASAIVSNGGGVQVVDGEYRIVLSEGLDTIQKTQFSAQEFTTFLAESKSRPYHYDILYHPQGDYWLIVTFPTSIRLDFSLIYNGEAAGEDFLHAGGALAAVILIYLAVVALFALIGARATAARVTVPLKKLCDGTRLLREGDYSARVDLRLKNEFAELQTTFNDMAARIEREISLRKKSEEDRKRLILDISHDLKNPMTGIQGYAELLLAKPELTSQERNEYLSVILNNSKRANRLLGELFELSQMDSPDFSLKTERTDLTEYLRRTCAELVPLLERAGFVYGFDIPEESVFAMLDTVRFSRVLSNLVDNAIRHNPKGTTLTVRMAAEGNIATINVSDDGTGIPSHLAQDIFKPFTRADDARNPQTGGSGLGLSIAKKIAAAHGGDLTLVAGEKGSTFRIQIPTI